MAVFFAYPFGVDGDLTAIPNPSQAGGLVSYQTGFTINYEYNLATNPSAYPIPRTQFNQLMYDITNAIQQYQTDAIPQFITSSETVDSNPYPYNIYAQVRYNVGSPGSDGSGTLVYENQVQGNTATPGADNTWSVISGAGTIMPGTMLDFGGDTAPAGYLVCNGQSVSTTTYAALFAAIGYIWGGSGGSFNVPNLERRTTMGSGGSGSAVIGNTVGATGGEEVETISVNNLPDHSHSPFAGEDNFVMTSAGSNAFSLTSGAYSVDFHSQTGTIEGGTTNTPLNIIQPSAVVLKIIKF